MRISDWSSDVCSSDLAPDVQIRNQAQAGNVFNRLMRRTIFAKTDRIMREHVDAALLHQRRHANRVARVVREHQEGAAERNQAAVQRDAVHRRRHAEFAHAVVDRSEEHTSELQSLMRISYAVFCLKKKKNTQ